MSYYDYYMPEAFNSASDTYIDKVIVWACVWRSHDSERPQKQYWGATWGITSLLGQGCCLEASGVDRPVVDCLHAELGEPTDSSFSSWNVLCFFYVLFSYIEESSMSLLGKYFV